MSSGPRPSATTTVPPEPLPSTQEPPKLPPKPQPNDVLRTLFLRTVLRIFYRLDRALTRLTALLSSPTATDALLCTLSYTLELLRALLSRTLERQLRQKPTPTVLLPGDVIIAPRRIALLAQAVGSTKALAAAIGDYRVFVRLWGLLGIYTWAKATWRAPLEARAGGREKVLRSVAWAQIISCTAFQVLENAAYLSSKGALTGSNWTGMAGKARETRYWVWSSRFWALHVGLEFVRLYAIWYHQGNEEDSHWGEEKEAKMKREEKRRESFLWWRDVVSNVAYFPMTLHWSSEAGFLSDMSIGALGAVAGGALLVDAWRQTPSRWA
jgi:hypothetical protein